MEKKELEIGMRLYATNSEKKISHVVTVERVTKTQAIATNAKGHEYRFKKELPLDSFIKELGTGAGSIYTSRYFTLETPELKAKLKRQNQIKFIKSFDFETLNEDKLQQIYSNIVKGI
jgi:outer membrane phospholipase A